MNTNLKNHLSDELLSLLSSVKHHYIESEHPDHHWNYLEVHNQIVLDLGCGFHLSESSWPSTPQYFLNKGAKEIIGVDPECSDINYFNNTIENGKFFCDKIDSVEKLNYYINNFKITSLKMDIEWQEKFFLESNENFDSLKYVAIETHDKTLLNAIVQKLINMNFKIDTICTFYPRVYDICNLIYAHK